MVDVNSVSSVQAPSATQPIVRNPAPDAQGATDPNAQNAAAADLRPETLAAPEETAATAPSSSSVYNAVSSANSSTIRGVSLDVVT